MPVLIPSKIKQMGIDKAYKLVDAIDVELSDGSDVQEFVDNFEDKLAGYVTVKDNNFGTAGQFAVSNADGTISFTSTTSAEDPDLIASDGTKFRFGVDAQGQFGYIVKNKDTGNDQFIPFKTGDGETGSAITISSYRIAWDPHTLTKIIISNSGKPTIVGSYIDKTME